MSTGLIPDSSRWRETLFGWNSHDCQMYLVMTRRLDDLLMGLAPLVVEELEPEYIQPRLLAPKDPRKLSIGELRSMCGLVDPETDQVLRELHADYERRMREWSEFARSTRAAAANCAAIAAPFLNECERDAVRLVVTAAPVIRSVNTMAAVAAPIVRQLVGGLQVLGPLHRDA